MEPFGVEGFDGGFGADPGEEFVEEAGDDGGFGVDDVEHAVVVAVAVGVAGVGFALGVFGADSPAGVGRDGFGFGLGEGGKQSEQDFAVGGVGVDVPGVRGTDVDQRPVPELGPLDLLEGLAGSRVHVPVGVAVGNPEIVGGCEQAGHRRTCPKKLLWAIAGSPF